MLGVKFARDRLVHGAVKRDRTTGIYLRWERRLTSREACGDSANGRDVPRVAATRDMVQGLAQKIQSEYYQALALG